jgi:hypothetical protein
MTRFVPGLALSRAFYREAVKPVLDEAFPVFSYSAALIGPGSEVLGFDTEMSADHDWGPRVMIFHRPGDRELKDTISDCLAERLPTEVR